MTSGAAEERARPDPVDRPLDQMVNTHGVQPRGRERLSVGARLEQLEESLASIGQPSKADTDQPALPFSKSLSIF
jgi:hypothetical protein